MVKMTAERLPDLHVPRAGHSIVVAGGELTVVGGHTTSFVPTPTLEYYSDGEWHLVETAYTHDNGLATVLASGDVLLAGGHAESLGIGQTFTAERYSLATHTSRGFGCLDTKRAAASGLLLPDGQVLISGNWYHDDAIECYDGQQAFSTVKTVAQPRSNPFILATSPTDAIIFGLLDNHGSHYDTIWTDRLRGEPFCEPLLQQWHPLAVTNAQQPSAAFIGDAARGSYRYLLPVSDAEGCVALMQTRGEHFSLLPTDSPVPTRSQWGEIYYTNGILADTLRDRAYLVGMDDDSRLYALCAEGVSGASSQEPARLTLYYTDPLTDVGDAPLALLPDGRLAIAGGYRRNNFVPLAAVYLLNPGIESAAAAASGAWLWWLLGGALLLVAVALAALWRRRSRGADTVERTTVIAPTEEEPQSLYDRICSEMESGQLFLNPDLKPIDVAVRIGVDSRDVTAALQAHSGTTFPTFVNDYRVRHVQQLLYDGSEQKFTSLWREAGFTSERTFFRCFKQATGMTPSEWQLSR